MFNIEKKSKFWKIEKPTWRYYHFIHLHHKWQSYDVWFLRNRVRQTEFFIILDCFCPFTHLWSHKIKILNKKKKKKKNTWRYYHFIYVYHKWQSLDAWLLRYGVQRTEFNVVLGFFLPFHPCNNQKSQNFVKMKKMHGDTIILHMCAINDNHMMYGS